MSKFFNIESPLMQFMTKVAELILLNILFIITSLPVVTIGASSTALYYVTLKMIRDEESAIVRSYFHAFRTNFRQATVLWLSQLVLMVILILDMWILAQIDAPAAPAMNTAVFILLVILLLVSLYLYPMQAKFENPLKNTLKNACLIAVGSLPQTLMMGALCVGSAVITLYNEYTMAYGAAVWLLLGFAAIAFGNSGILNKVIDKYIPGNDRNTDK